MSLPPPIYNSDDFTIYCGDCRDILPSLTSCRFDGVIADPPFGIGYGKYRTYKDTSIDYGEFVWDCISKAEKLCNPGAPIFVWQAMRNVRHFADWFPRDFRIFAAAKSFIQMRPTPMQFSYDPVIVWWTEGDELYTRGTANRDFHVADTAPSSRKAQRFGDCADHPCPRPLHQVAHIIDQWIRPGGCIIDPFLGSGTTLLAAQSVGCCGVGIEIDDEYCRISARRLNEPILPFGKDDGEKEETPCREP